MTSELPEMRASDAERERVAEVLREAVAEGRLQMEEFEQRLDATYKARTHGELEPTAPPDLNVEVRGIGVMGGFRENTKYQEIPAPDSPRVRITGFALMGGVRVERKRTRAEKQRLRDAERSQGGLEKGRSESGGLEKGRSERGRLEKGRSERGRLEKGRSERGRLEESRSKRDWLEKGDGRR